MKWGKIIIEDVWHKGHRSLLHTTSLLRNAIKHFFNIFLTGCPDVTFFCSSFSNCTRLRGKSDSDIGYESFEGYVQIVISESSVQ